MITLAKKDKNEKKEKEFSPDELQKRMQKYYKAQESEKRGKALAGSIVGFSILCFVVLLIVILKLSGVGKTVVFTTDENGNAQTQVVDTSDVEATNLADVIGEEIMEDIESD